MSSFPPPTFRRQRREAPPGRFRRVPLLGQSEPDSREAIVSLPPWLYPPVNWENIDLINYVALPAIGASANVLSYVVPPGRNGVIWKVANNFVGGGFNEGSGNVIWRILADGSTPPGATNYDNILASLGSPASPTQIAGFRIFENQVITLVVVNASVVVSGQLSGGRFIGWNYPRELEDADIWI